MDRCLGDPKIATRVQPSLCNATQTSYPPDLIYEHVACAASTDFALASRIRPGCGGLNTSQRLEII